MPPLGTTSWQRTHQSAQVLSISPSMKSSPRVGRATWKAFLDAEAGDPSRPTALVLRSKIELARGDYERAEDLAHAAARRARGTADAGLALVNLGSILGAGGPVEEAVAAVRLALEGDLSLSQRYVAQASLALWEASEEGNLLEIADGLRELAVQQERDGRSRYAGISRLNLAGILLRLGEASQAVREATTARRRWEAEPAPPWSASQLLRSGLLPWPSGGVCRRL